MPEDINIAGRLSRNTAGRIQSSYTPIPNALRYAVGFFAEQVMPIEVVRPAPNTVGYYDLDFFGYVGRAVRIPICVQGGAHPQNAVIREAPAGATISNEPWTDGKDYLVLEFTPTAEGVYPIRVDWYDAIGAHRALNWSFTVSPTPFVFVSTTGNDTSGVGTKASPWATRSKAFATATGGKILILEDGTYNETTLGLSFTTSTVNSIAAWSSRGATIDLSAVSSTGTGVMLVTNSSHVHIQGIIFQNPPTTVANQRWFSCDNSGRYLYQDDCEFRIDGRIGTVNNDNTSCWMLGGDEFTDRRYVAQTYCKFTGFAGVGNGWSSIDTYATRYAVIRNNEFDDQRSTTTTAGIIWIKGLNNRNIDIMYNDFKVPFGGGIIDIHIANQLVGGVPTNNTSGNIDVAFNIIRSTGPAGIWLLRSSQGGTRLPIWTRRNTSIGAPIIVFDRAFAATISSDSDVIQSTASTSDPFKVCLRRDEAYHPLSEMESLTYSVTNYECHQNSGVVNASAELVGAYRTNYLGRRGRETLRGN